MPRETKADRAARAAQIVDRLFTAHPDAHCALDYADAFQLLCATILSAQCTDKMVNTVTPALFRRYPTPADLARAEDSELHELIRSTGFYKNKAKSLQGMADAVIEHHAGEIPATLAELIKLPGVGRKTANVILGNAFEIPGLVVDTHVGRIARRLGLTQQTDAVKVEQELMALVERDSWTQFSHAMIFHGRRVCVARNPKCDECTLRLLCPYGPPAKSREPRRKTARGN
jgi:endonuclease-3